MTLDNLLTWLQTTGVHILLAAALWLLVWLTLRAGIVAVLGLGQLSDQARRMVLKIVGWLVALVATASVLEQSGVDLGMAWGVVTAVVAMVAIGFVAVWSILSNTLCAGVLIANRPFRVGDRVDFVEAVNGPHVGGTVVAIGLIYTTLREDTGGRLRIPNNIFFQKILRVGSATAAPPTEAPQAAADGGRAAAAVARGQEPATPDA